MGRVRAVNEGVIEIPWWADHMKLAVIARYLVEQNGSGVDEVLYMLEKPWKFETEYALAVQLAGEGAGG